MPWYACSGEAAKGEEMRFGEVVGHDRVGRMLRQAVHRDHVAHAWLFHGPEGVGKRTMARAFLSYLSCPNRTEEDSCGACPACRLLDQELYPDVTTLSPEKGSILIDQVREAFPRLLFPPVMGPIKGILVDDAHALTLQAANAALKTLEEPPPGVVFVLITSAPDLLPRTVVSRCFPVPFGRLSTREVEGMLRARGVADPDAQVAASMARGRPGLALRLATGGRLSEGMDLLEALLEVPHPTARLEMAENLGKGKEEASDRMVWIESLIRDLLRVSLRLPAEACAHQNLHQRMQALVDRIGADAVLEMAEAFLAWDRNRVYTPSLGLALHPILAPLDPR